MASINAVFPMPLLVPQIIGLYFSVCLFDTISLTCLMALSLAKSALSPKRFRYSSTTGSKKGKILVSLGLYEEGSNAETSTSIETA
ncbi:hypothetical protein EDD86DRAFT_208325, partial [Gorgonomyces haynaldii]